MPEVSWLVAWAALWWLGKIDPMTTITAEEFRLHLDQYLAEAAEGDVVLTQAGKPGVLLRAVASADADDLAKSPKFWQMIHQRRQEKGIPWEEAQKLLDLD